MHEQQPEGTLRRKPEFPLNNFSAQNAKNGFSTEKYLQVSANVIMLKYSLLFRFINLNTKTTGLPTVPERFRDSKTLNVSAHFVLNLFISFSQTHQRFFTNLRHISKMKTQLSSGRGLPVLYAKRISWPKAIGLSDNFYAIAFVSLHFSQTHRRVEHKTIQLFPCSCKKYFMNNAI